MLLLRHVHLKFAGHFLPGGNVTVAGAGHGDDGPVQGLGQSVEHRVWLILLQRVA